jgi:hypothetical protein
MGVVYSLTQSIQDRRQIDPHRLPHRLSFPPTFTSPTAFPYHHTQVENRSCHFPFLGSGGLVLDTATWDIRVAVTLPRVRLDGSGSALRLAANVTVTAGAIVLSPSAGILGEVRMG